jgi:hypothetical protein
MAVTLDHVAVAHASELMLTEDVVSTTAKFRPYSVADEPAVPTPFKVV